MKERIGPRIRKVADIRADVEAHRISEQARRISDWQEGDPLPVRIETTWDPHTRSWYTILVSKEGWQVGHAAYSGNRADRDVDIKTYERVLAEFKEMAQ